MEQIRIAVLSNAGGAGKTTLTVHLGYELAHRGFSTILFDLDPNQSLELFTGLLGGSLESPTIVELLEEKHFLKGQYPLVHCWTEHTDKVEVCFGGGLKLVKFADGLVVHDRGAYLLADCLEDYPLPHQVLLYDCPATIGPLNRMALAASTHVLIPIEAEPKAQNGASILLEWFFNECRNLRLRPKPEILGIVVNRLKPKRAQSKETLAELPVQLEGMGINFFSPIHEYTEFVNASSYGLPLQVHRPGYMQGKPLVAFREIGDVISNLLVSL